MFSKKKFFLYYNIYFAGILLIILGSIFVLSSTFAYGLEKNNLTFYFVKHIQYLFIGVGLLYLAQRINIYKLEKISNILFFISFLLLFIPVFQHGLRWAKLGPIRFQPSEFVKLTFILFLASYFKKRKPESFRDIFIPLVICFLVIGILQLQKDLGTSVIILSIFAGILFLCGLKIKYIVFISGISIIIFIGLIFLFPYRIERIKSFGKNYQTKQSIISISSGGFFGKGLGAGIRKLRYVPEIHKDFVYAVVGEELGFAGTVGVLILFSIIVFCGFEISYFCSDFFEKLLVSGISILFGIQFILHACVVLGIFPTKGTTLPFFSVGGSSLMTNLLAFGFLLKTGKKIGEETNIKYLDEIIIHLK
ncbi:MAG: FtsW/RodA/SpoVE family cell cycle protein [Candidatus Ratteibacteria bacterium]